MSLTPPNNLSAIVDTGDKFFTGVVDTAEQFIAGVNDTEIFIREYLREFSQKIQNGPNGILGGLEDTDSWKKPKVENLVSDSL